MPEKLLSLERFTQNKWSRGLTLTLIFVILMPLTMWLLWVMGQQDIKQGFVLLAYIAFLGYYALQFLIDFILDVLKQKPDNRIINIAGIGNKPALISIFALTFLWLGWLMTTNNLGVSVPQSLGQEQLAFLDTIYKVVLSPLLEELAIRGAFMLLLTGIMLRFTNKGYITAFIVGLLGSSAFFGALHWLAYQGEPGLILTSIIWGMLAGILVWITGSILPAIMFHIGNNASIHFTQTGQGFLVMPILIGLSLLIIAANAIIINAKGLKWWTTTLKP